jgi:hypothetical protein
LPRKRIYSSLYDEKVENYISLKREILQISQEYLENNELGKLKDLIRDLCERELALFNESEEKQPKDIMGITSDSLFDEVYTSIELMKNEEEVESSDLD